MRRVSACVAGAVVVLASLARADPPSRVVDLAAVGDGSLIRVFGSLAEGGERGVPVAGGLDVDDDGHRDFVGASMLASPLGRTGAGELFLIFGDGMVAGSYDSAANDPRVLRIIGDGVAEATGSQVWMDDVTGDGLGDLLIGRQNFRPDSARPGAGALTIVVGSPALRTLADVGGVLDLRSPAAGLRLVTVVGPAETARLGMWIRTGDSTGDGLPDIAVSADQENGPDETHRGAVYLIQGGPHLDATQTVDLAEFGTASLALGERVARLRPPAGASEYHFGSTCQLADLDGNGRSEVLAAAALSRGSAALLADGAPPGSAHANGGTTDGTLFIGWDENFDVPWPVALDLAIDTPGFVRSVIDGGSANRRFAEEIVGGRDWDGDGRPDLFVGDLVGNAAGRPQLSGLGHVIFGADELRGLEFDLDSPPGSVRVTHLLGSESALAADTAVDGDFDGDGRFDLALSSPHASPLGRVDGGTLHVLFGQSEPWPDIVDLADGALPPAGSLRVAEIHGAHGEIGTDRGDTLAYSAAAGELDGDGRAEIITNEMLGNGTTAAAEDAGNLIVIPGHFFVPEPSSRLLALAALGALVGIAQRHLATPRGRAR